MHQTEVLLVKRTRRLQKARMHLHLLEEELKEVTEERDNLVVKLQKNQKLVHQTEVLLVKRKPLEEELKEVKEERNNLMAKLQKNEKLVAELQGAVECPVCLVVPREGPVPCCPSGHITCSPCLERMRGEGEEECPTCRVPMGEGKSLLAKHIIENMEHQCSHQGCEEMVAFEGYREHQEACSYRLVICPGNDKRCNEMVPFCQMEDHLETCSGTYFLYEKELEVEARKNELDGACTSAEFYNNFGEVFCLRMNKTNNLYSMEVVMLGKEEECEQFTMEVAVMNPDTNTAAILARFKPRPILATNDTGHFCLTFKQESLARVWKYDKERRSYKFKIVIKVVSTCEESPKKHLEADTEPFTLCDEFGAMDLSDSDQDPDYSPSEEEDCHSHCEDSIEYDSEAVVTEEDSEEDSEEETEEDSEEEHGEEEETAVVVKAM